MKKLSEMTMDEARAAWLAALRSGTRKQAKNRLHTSEGFCCLGVACDLDVEAGGSEWVPPSLQAGVKQEPDQGYRWVSKTNKRDTEVVILPDSIQERLGLDLNPEDMSTLAVLNDRYGCTFAEIADVLELYFNGDSQAISNKLDQVCPTITVTVT